MRIPLLLLLALVTAIYCTGCKDREEEKKEASGETVFKRVASKRHGFDLEIPKDWEVEVDDTPQSFELRILPPGESFIVLQMRYIEQRPEGIESHKEWVEFQYAEQKEAGVVVESITPQGVIAGSCFKVRLVQRTPEETVFGYSLNYMNHFERPDDRAVWVMAASALNKNFFETDDFERFVKSIVITKFSWGA